ncbi:MAG TPA: 4Fe-4S dicluster domain-containing protein [Planctomycetes bacterium]|nr:4Fe-4S dicluster domain-containing protein [Planctomycetota bacterium]
MSQLPILQDGGAGAPVDQLPEPTEAEVRAIREELSGLSGDAYWERLEALSETGPFRRFLARWFPSQAERLRDGVERRDFLRIMGASLAMAGMGACTRQPKETIVPFARTPEYLIPGKPRYFATAFPTGRDALGILVESHMNRPTKVEGNPNHPTSLGSTDAFAQAALLGLYDPDRSQSVLLAGEISTFDDFQTAFRTQLDEAQANAGAGMALLLSDTTSPTVALLLEVLRSRMPRLAIHHWSALHRDAEREAALRLFGRDVEERFDLARARVIAAIDSDPLAFGPGNVRHARDFAAGRKPSSGGMSRLYAIESTDTLTGAAADHRIGCKPSVVEAVVRFLAAELGVDVEVPELDAERTAFARALAADLRSAGSAAVLIGGDSLSADARLLIHRIHAALGCVGTTVEYVEPTTPWQDGAVEAIRSLAGSIRAGEVRTLLILGGNPVYDAPADLDFRSALLDVPFRAHLSTIVDETSELCHWHLPEAHFLESWGDARSLEGSYSILQPLIAPLYGGRSVLELLASLAGEGDSSAYDLVRATWMRRTGLEGREFETLWATSLNDGLVHGAREEAVAVRPRSGVTVTGTFPTTFRGYELSFRADASTLDGSFANNGWLQEAPRPLTRLTWGNAVLMAPMTAEAIGVENGDVVRVSKGERSLEGPVWITPTHPEGSITLHLGYGRTKGGSIANGVGFDAYRLRTGDASWTADGFEIERTGRSEEMASVQDHASMEGRDLVRVTTFDRFKKNPHGTEEHGGEHGEEELSFFPDYEYNGYAWGMVIDLNACIGCSACMVACQSENNIPIVGKTEVARGRELHWIRIDRYFGDEEDGAEVLHQPIPCMHCEKAPCELVCPVGATVHGPEGLNEMVYNRCVGTRYCANNCPYKVRRFNFFKYSDYETESLKLANNPDVTVRSRGVMEKCTYCVQRINHARIQAKEEDRRIADGEAMSACMQVCPTQAIAFGDINDHGSLVAEQRKDPRHYALLEELGTEPRTTYLARVTNPNPSLGKA